METPFPPFEPNGRVDSSRGPRLSQIPLRIVIPNVITVLAICAGLTGIRLAFEHRFELAVTMVLIAAFLDGIDGRFMFSYLIRRVPSAGLRRCFTPLPAACVLPVST
jgi:hypothetical protein